MTSRTVLATLALVLLNLGNLIAQEQNVISVVGSSSINVPVDQVKIVVKLSQSDEKLDAAFEKFKAQKQQFVDKMNPMDFADVTVKYLGKSVGNNQSTNAVAMMGFGGGGQVEDAAPFGVSESVEISMEFNPDQFEPTMDKVCKIVEAMQDIDAEIGTSNPAMAIYGIESSGLLTGSIADPSVAEKEAFAEALQDARTKAEILAELAGLELGKVVGIAESQTQLDNDSGVADWSALMFGNNGSAGLANGGAVRSIEIKKVLNVRFAIK